MAWISAFSCVEGCGEIVDKAKFSSITEVKVQVNGVKFGNYIVEKTFFLGTTMRDSTTYWL